MKSCHKPLKFPRFYRGFGLLEALVALVLLSSVGFALLAWVQQNLDTTQRLREFYAEQDARRMALNWIRSLNPMDYPEGKTEHNGLKIVWKNIPETPSIPQVGYPQGIGKHEVALYKTEIQVYKLNSVSPWFTEQISTIGYRRAGSRASAFN